MHERLILCSAAALTVAFGAACPAYADDTQAWGSLGVQAGLGGPLVASAEATFRTSDARGFYEIEQSVLLGFKVDRHVTAWIGYVHTPGYSHGDFTGMEHRFRQQVTFDNVARIGPFKAGGRLRLEQRWREGASGTGWRLRPQIKLSWPFAGKTALNLTHESFINLGKTSFQKVDGHERMRNAVSISTPLTRQVKIEVGYLEQHGFVRNAPDTDDHVATVGLSASF